MQKFDKDESQDLMVLLGKNIAYRRKKLGMTQRELAEKLDITDNAIVRMEKGSISPKMSRLHELAYALECRVVSLFEVEHEEFQEKTRFIIEKIEKFSPDKQVILFDIIKSAIKLIEKDK